MGISAYITNLGKYNEGYLVGKWVKFPITPEELKKVFEDILLDGIRYEEFFITDYEVEPHIKGIASTLGEYANLDELNYLAAKLEDLTESDKSVFYNAASIESYDIIGLINLTENLDGFILIPNVSNEAELGDYLFEQEREQFAILVKKLTNSYAYEDRQLAKYILKLESRYDAEGHGRDFTFSVVGGFCDDGFIYETDDMHTAYSGCEDIPEEYKVFRVSTESRSSHDE